MLGSWAFVPLGNGFNGIGGVGMVLIPYVKHKSL